MNIKLTLNRDPFPSIKFNNLKSFILSCANFLSQFVERFVLLKFSTFGYWNNVNANLRATSTLLISYGWTMLIFKFSYLINLDFDNEKDWKKLGVFGAIFVAHYFHERTAYHQKWHYLASLYNEVLKASPFVTGKETLQEATYSYRESLELALAIDTVQMEMWSHDSFRSIVEKWLILHQKGKYPQISNEDALIKASEKTKAESIKILIDIQKQALKMAKDSYSDNVYLIKAG